MERTTAEDAVLESRLDAELLMVREAIVLVASGQSPRVAVAGLRLGEAILEPARGIAREAGVRLVPLWTGDERPLDIRVEGLEA
jgi:hypothetical protein